MERQQISLRLPAIELEILDRYAKSRGRTRSDVLREFIRSLEGKS